ncbi:MULTISPECIES: glutathione S-transferase family protein [Pseudomonas]|jgi:glutathione S-transferase|uniref:Glutathione S-transferase family protein n=2 Tax=Pseudomonas lactis TaxID=1615674 RepID=A0A7Y1Q9K1_9PSED|nr:MULTISPECIES: glutathione S-transferase family protein [Pseudomonas]TKK12056.1 glutathione S-transferase family protein [Pseudomonas fluorescens]KRP84167.1 glutathione S-transferase [Pseudomonas lactis]MBI6978834.1 glutathione S-transferase family protein [Pseudomonas lactis]MCF4974137.1 glutathione S-transferase family protein [Pseudomonas lactis]MCF5004429.1 glutathione S-transferase family protein [Pseudomonas lactis]
MSTKLVIGDFNKSSWSFRAWLVLVTADVSFETLQLKLEQSDTRQQILEHSPSGRVPALLLNGIVINDSLAISEYVADAYPGANLWPQDPQVKALARAAAAEMHSGFTHLRTQMSFGLNTGDTPETLTAQTREEVMRVFDIWNNLRALSGSKQFLCGDFGIVDAMFVPVVFRFRRYGIAIPAQLQGYVDNILAYAPVQQWLKLAAQEV